MHTDCRLRKSCKTLFDTSALGVFKIASFGVANFEVARLGVASFSIVSFNFCITL